MSRVEIKGTPYSYETSQNEQLVEIAERVREMRTVGSLSPDVLIHLRNFFRIKNIYNSNAIEGNELDLGETKLVVQQGLTLTGKPLKDQAEAQNLSDALTYLEDLAVDTQRPVSERDIREIHRLVLKGVNDDNAGRYRNVPVEISGSEFKPPGPESVAAQMEDFGEWLSKASIDSGEPGDVVLVNAAIAHTWLVYVHPFIDGNGRVARLLMNLLMMRSGFPIAIISKEDRLRYYDALEESQTSDLSAFIGLLVECVHESLEEYERAAKQQKKDKQWLEQLADRFDEGERTRRRNEYEVWKNAMELLRSYFRQTCEILGRQATAARTYFKDFGQLDFEKYLSLCQGESVKRTWFFRVDFRSGNRAARYLFFFGFPSHQLSKQSEVTLHVAREEPPGSFHYQRLIDITAPNVPSIVEVGYERSKERFITRDQMGGTSQGRVEKMGKRFFDDVIRLHFNS